MSLSAWVIVALAAWFVIGLGVAMVLGHIFRKRDEQRPDGLRAAPAVAPDKRRRRSA